MNGRNYSIDILKFICACLIVMLHTDFTWHDAVLPLTRCAVPCFLIISGFLLYFDKGIGQERLKRNVRHIWHIMLWATLLFFIVKEAMAISNGEMFVPSLRQWLYFIVLNENPFGFHLWYLGAYLYVLLLMIIIDKHKWWTQMFVATPFLLLCDLIFGKYSLLLLHHEFHFVLVRNFLFVGIPYFMIGVWLKKNIANLMCVNRYVFLGGVGLFSLTTLIEKMVISYLNKNPTREHYLSTTFLAICLFLFVVSFKDAKCSKISKIGERDSLYIYIFHPLFLILLPKVINFMPNVVDSIYQYVAPLIVLLLTMILILILRKYKLI